MHAKLLSLLGWHDPAGAAAEIVAFETTIAEDSWDKAKLRDPDHPVQSALSRRAGDTCAGFRLERLSRRQPGSATVTASSSASPTPSRASPPPSAQRRLDTLKAWMAFHVADQAAPYLAASPSPTRASISAARRLLGQAEAARAGSGLCWPVAGGDCGADPASCFGTFNWGVGQLYAERYFPAETKQRIEALVADVKAAFRHRLEKLDWMSPATRAEALKKLDTYTIKVGYPDKWRDYSNLVIRRDDLVGNVRRAAAADWQFYVDRSTGPVDKADWVMTPADQRRLQRLAARYRLSRRHPPGADVRPQRRPGLQLWRDRRRHRARADPRLRRSGPLDRRVGRAARLVDARRTPPSSSAAPRSSARNMRSSNRCRASTSSPT